MHSKKTAFIVEHDFIMATYMADRVIVYDGIASKDATARTPQSLQTGEGGEGGERCYLKMVVGKTGRPAGVGSLGRMVRVIDDGQGERVYGRV